MAMNKLVDESHFLNGLSRSPLDGNEQRMVQEAFYACDSPLQFMCNVIALKMVQSKLSCVEDLMFGGRK